MRRAVPVSASRFFGALILGLTFVTGTGCSSPEPPEPPDRSDPVVFSSPETTPEPDPTPPEPDPTTPEPDPTPPEPQMEWSVPDSVVGVWCGGANDQPDGHWTYVFTAQGEVAAQNERTGFSGHVVTEADVMTFYVEGTDPWQSTWAVGYEEALDVNLLYLDDYSYYPGSCDS